MDTSDRSCEWGDDVHPRLPKHTHPYTPGKFASRRCTCGNRTFVVAVGEVGGPSVECAKCRRPNFGATAYEVGRYDGHRPARPSPTAAAPF